MLKRSSCDAFRNLTYAKNRSETTHYTIEPLRTNHKTYGSVCKWGSWIRQTQKTTLKCWYTKTAFYTLLDFDFSGRYYKNDVTLMRVTDSSEARFFGKRNCIAVPLLQTLQYGQEFMNLWKQFTETKIWTNLGPKWISSILPIVAQAFANSIATMPCYRDYTDRRIQNQQHFLLCLLVPRLKIN